MITATIEDRLKWVKTIVTTDSPAVLLETVDKIWEDGYRCAEAEVTYSHTSKEIA